MPDSDGQAYLPGSRSEKRLEGVSPNRTRVNILLVDDNPNKLLALETAIAPLGEQIVKASSGAEALRELLARNFAVIILDVSMPVMDGFETALTIRGRPRSANTPIIFASAINLSEDDALRGYSLGAVDYIVAPIIPEVLRAKVSVFVQLHRMTEEAKLRARQLEESQSQLRLAERMASLGTLAAGLGHDMGNILLPIHAQLDDLDTASLPPNVAETLAALGKSVKYLSRLASGLRLLALAPGDGDRDDHGQQSTDVSTWWPDVEPILKNAVPRGIELSFKYCPGLPPAAVAKHLLTQIVFNLVQNAGEALRERGRGRVAVAAEQSGGYLLLQVSDDGPGMTPEVRRRCLEPFFTTKSRTLSTGLGLAMVNGIVRRAGGTMEIESNPGIGTTFICRLPLSVNAGAAAPRALVTVAEPRLRAMIASLLRVHGFDVGSASDRQAPPTLWVADAAEQISPDIHAFLSGGPNRRLLVLGDTHEPLHSDQIVALPSGLSMPELRKAVAALAKVGRPEPHPAVTAAAPAT